jgi:hypothetical protein
VAVSMISAPLMYSMRRSVGSASTTRATCACWRIAQERCARATTNCSPVLGVVRQDAGRVAAEPRDQYEGELPLIWPAPPCRPVE